MEYSLKFLLSQIKKPGLSLKQKEQEACQRVFISKISGNDFANNAVVFKGGIVMSSLTKGERGHTKDIDLDFVKYPLSESGIANFISSVNKSAIYANIRVGIISMEDLRQKNYFGKRVHLSFSDSDDSFSLDVDIGVYVPLVKRYRIYEYEISSKPIGKIHVSSNEQMIAEKLSTFAIYGKDNSRFKDLFDAYWLIENVRYDREAVSKMLWKIMKKKDFFPSPERAKAEIIETLTDKNYIHAVGMGGNNWLSVDVLAIASEITKFVSSL